MIGIHEYPEFMIVRDSWVVGIHACPGFMSVRDSWVSGIHGCPGLIGVRDSWVSGIVDMAFETSISEVDWTLCQGDSDKKLGGRPKILEKE